MHRLGKRVKFIGYTDRIHPPETYEGDDPEPGDAIMKKGDVGTVVGHEVDCGGSPDDPMHIVWVKGKGKDGYWAEELEAANGP